MTLLLERAMEQVQALSENEQDSIASMILEELRSEARWQAAFDGSQAQLSILAAEALAEFRAGITPEMNLDGR